MMESIGGLIDLVDDTITFRTIGVNVQTREARQDVSSEQEQSKVVACARQRREGRRMGPFQRKDKKI